MDIIKTILFLIILFISSSHLIAQNDIRMDSTLASSYLNKATAFDKDKKYDSALVYYQEALTIYKELFGEKNPDVANSYNNIGNVYVSTEEYDLAFKYYLKALNIFKELYGESNFNVAKSYCFVGLTYKWKGEYDLASENFLKALTVNKKLFGKQNLAGAWLYKQLGIVYHEESKYDLALEYYLKALNIKVEILTEKNPEIAELYTIIGDVYHNKGENDLELHYYLKAVDIQKELFGEKHQDVADTYYDIGNTYYDKVEYDLALEYYLKASTIYKELFGKNHQDVADTYNDIGLTYHDKGEYDLALEYQMNALSIRKKLNNEKHPDVAMSYLNIGTVHWSKGENKLAFEYFLKATNIYKEFSTKYNVELAILYNNIGQVFMLQGEHDLSLQYYQKALNIREDFLVEKNRDIVGSYNNIGTVYILKGEYDFALEYFLKASEIQKEFLGEHHPVMATIYTNIGQCYRIEGGYDLALEYFLKALNIKKEFIGKNHPDIATIYHRIGDVYYNKDEYDLSMQHNKKALNIRKKTLGEKNSFVASSYNSIGIVYVVEGEYDLALEYYLKALTIYKELFGEKHPDVAVILSNIGNVYYYKKEYELAIKYYQKTLTIQREVWGEKHPSLANSFNNLGFIYLAKEEYNLALNYYHLGLIANLKDFNDSLNLNSNPIINNYFESIFLVGCLYGKARAFYELQNLKASFINIQLCDTLITQMHKTISTKTDKMTLALNANQIYERAIQLCFELGINSQVPFSKNDLKAQGFYFSEKCKANVLLEALTGQESLKFAGIPDSLLQKEHTLKVSITNYNKKFAESTDSTNKMMYRDKLFELNRQYEELIAKFEKNYTDYYNLKYTTNNPTTKNIQNILDNKTAIRSYFLGDSNIYIFTLTNKNLDVKQVAKIPDLTDNISRFRYGLTKTSQRMQEYYRRIGFLLYQQLFPDGTTLDKRITELIIIPDGNLAILPFESLLTDNYTGNINDYKNYPFLIKKYNISYSYSANLFYRTFPKRVSSSGEMTKLNDWLAFAPVFDNDTEQGMVISTHELQKQLSKLKTDTMMTNRAFFTGNYISPLPGTVRETQEIFKLFEDNNLKASVLLHKNANEQFIKSGGLKNYKNLHFATHGFVNSERPELSGILLAQDSTGGQDGILYSGEIYNLKLNADLVVLSACETGLGKIQKGEGIIGLTRALLYTGTKNIIVSLWQVGDQSTSDLMVDFYKNVLESKPKSSYSQCLSLAKLKMINEGEFAHPLYWSPFILIGK